MEKKINIALWDYFIIRSQSWIKAASGIIDYH